MNFKNLDKRLVTILLIVFVQMLGASMILPILPLYAQREFKLSPEANTLLISAFFAAQFVAGPTIGRLSDRYGRVPILIISQIGTAISFAMIGLAESVFILFAARIFDGITGGNIIVAQAYVTDIMPKKERTRALGYIFAAFGIGFIFGPALGGILSAAFGATVPFILAAIAAAGVVVLTWRTLDETLTAEQRMANRQNKLSKLSTRDVFGNRTLLTTLAIVFVAQFGMGLLQATFALYGEAIIFEGFSEEMATLGVGLLLASVGLTQFTTQMAILPRLTARFSDITLVAAGTLLRSLAFIIFVLSVTPWIGVVGSVAFALSFGIMLPPLQSFMTKLVPDEVRGAILGWFQSTTSLSTIASTALGGVLFAISPRTPYWLGAFLSLIVVIPMLTFLRRTEAETEELEAAVASAD